MKQIKWRWIYNTNVVRGDGSWLSCEYFNYYQVFRQTPPSRCCDIRVGEVVGWRSWLFNGDLSGLRSYTRPCEWIPGVPVEGDVDTWGVFAYKTRNRLFEEPICNTPIIYGSVYLWGEIVEHKHGYRAQYASIRSVDQIIGPGDDLLEFLRQKYGVEEQV
jgi:hypothetical protein